jgi:predicted ATPase
MFSRQPNIRAYKIPSSMQPFKDIIWENIPKFSVITGKNGVGKSTFLYFIKMIYPSSLLINFEPNLNQKLELDMFFNQYIHRIDAYMEGKNDYFGHSEIIIYDKIIQCIQEYDDEKYMAQREFHEQYFYKSAIIKACLDKLQKFLTNFVGILTIALYLENTNKLNEYLKFKRYKYVISVKQRIFLQINPMENPKQEIEKSIPEIDIDTNVYFELESQKSNDNISINYVQLSSGERIMLYFYLLEYLMIHFMNSLESTQILMFDEPDSHMHPSKTKEMIELLQNLVKSMKCQIIITTNHPVTASFVNDESLFLMYLSEDGKLKLKNTKNCNINPIDRLADNLFIMSKSQIAVFVESKMKKSFLEQINKHYS